MLVFRNETKGIVSGIIRKSNKSDIIDINNILKDVFGADLTDRNCCYREIVEHGIKDRFYVFEEVDTHRVVACTGITKCKDGYEIDWTGTMTKYQGYGIMNKLFDVMLKHKSKSKDVYCSAWRVPNAEHANLHNILIAHGFELESKNVKEHGYLWDKPYFGVIGDCIRTCPYHGKTMPSECTCWEDMYIRKAK